MRLIISISLVLLLSSCSSKNRNETTTQSNKQNDNLIPINYHDTNYTDLAIWINDTVTKSGWNIKYFVKDDSTKYTDLYLHWSKGKSQGIYKMEQRLEMRRYFIPTFIGENNDFLFLEHGCSTSCGAVLVLSKDSIPTSKEYQEVVKYNIPLGQIVLITEQSWEHEQEFFEISVIDLKNEKEYKEKFNNICFGVWQHKPSCIDTIIFNLDFVTIETTLLEKAMRDISIKEKRVVKLELE